MDAALTPGEKALAISVVALVLADIVACVGLLFRGTRPALCTTCFNQGWPRSTGGEPSGLGSRAGFSTTSFVRDAPELVLLLTLCSGWVFYALFRARLGAQACAQCGSRTLIALDSPRARQLLAARRESTRA